MLAIDAYGNRVSGVSVTMGTSPNTPLSGTNPVTRGWYPGVRITERHRSVDSTNPTLHPLTIAATNTYQLTASGAGNATSDKFRIVQDLAPCDNSHQCKNNTSNGQTGNFTQYSFGQITSTGTYSDVLLTTQFTSGSDTSRQCGNNRTIGQSTELRAAGPTVSTTSTGYLVLIIPKNTLKADGVLSRGTPSFNVCLGALYLGDGSPGSYGGTHTAWIGKKTSGNGLAPANPVLDPLSGFIRYWAPPANCGTAGLHADGSDPCIYLRTKQKSDITALVNQHILAPGADANMHDADVAIVIYKPNPWDGKGGIY